MKAFELEKTKVLESREALTFYLETLFHEETETEVIEEPITEVVLEEPAPLIFEQNEISLLFAALGEQKVALPILDLKGVIGFEKQSLFKLPESKPYTMAYIQYHGKNIPINDLQWVFNSSGCLQPPSCRYDESKIQNLIILDDQSMAIPCTEIYGVTTVSNEQIKWRKSKARQEWLYGIITEDMSAVLNLEDIKQLFLKGILDSN